MATILLCVLSGFSSPEQLKSIRQLAIFAKWLFEGVNCWSVTSSECVYCQVCAPRSSTVSFVPRRSVSVTAAGGSVSTIWTPRAIETWLILSESLLAIYPLILNRMWEWMRIHALCIMIAVSLCLMRTEGVYMLPRHIYLEYLCFLDTKTLPDSCVVYWNAFWA